MLFLIIFLTVTYPCFDVNWFRFAEFLYSNLKYSEIFSMINCLFLQFSNSLVQKNQIIEVSSVRLLMVSTIKADRELGKRLKIQISLVLWLAEQKELILLPNFHQRSETEQDVKLVDYMYVLMASVRLVNWIYF